jgi:NADH:ubiquinone oxidoreductase subunit 6 (subunit J)/Pyruvate/2-oxoacid:ferredoxin oxidoreductase delta subunit
MMRSIFKYFYDIFNGVKSLVGGMRVTGSYFFRPSTIVTQKYPENRKTLVMTERFKGEVVMPHSDKNEHKCTGCGICEINCPNGTIEIISKMVEAEDGKKKKAIDKHIYRLGMCTTYQNIKSTWFTIRKRSRIMELNQIIFILFAAIVVVFSILTVTSRRILRAAVSLLFVLVSTAGLYFMLDFAFLAAVQLALYAGGIVVLIIFSILLTSHISQKMEMLELKKSIFSALAVVFGIILTVTTILEYKFEATTTAAAELNMNAIGKALLSYGVDGYVLPFEVISILLLAAMVAAIIIAKKGSPKLGVGSRKSEVRNTNP